MQKLFSVLDRSSGHFRPAAISPSGTPIFLVNADGSDFSTDPPAPPKSRVSIYLRGRILGDGEDGDGFHAAEIIASLQSVPSGVDEIHFWINSEGGSFPAVQQIIDAMAARPELKVGHVEGIALSGAFLILMACDQREASASARMLMHAPHLDGCIAGTTAETKWCVDFVARRCPNIPRAIIEAWTTRNNGDGDGVSLNGPMAASLGIVHVQWIDGKNSIPEIRQSERPFAHDGRQAGGCCKCAECSRGRSREWDDLVARRERRQAQFFASRTITVPKLPAALVGKVFASMEDFKPSAIAGPRDAAREALKAEALNRFKAHDAAQTRRIRAMAQG
jgi:Clp protease